MTSWPAVSPRRKVTFRSASTGALAAAGLREKRAFAPVSRGFSWVRAVFSSMRPASISSLTRRCSSPRRAFAAALASPSSAVFAPLAWSTSSASALCIASGDVRANGRSSSRTSAGSSVSRRRRETATVWPAFSAAVTASRVTPMDARAFSASGFCRAPVSTSGSK